MAYGSEREGRRVQRGEACEVDDRQGVAVRLANDPSKWSGHLERRCSMRLGRCGVLVLVFVLSVATAWGSARPADAVEYLGEYCWSFTSATHGSGMMKFGVVQLGGGHYFLSGGGGPEARHGNAEISGGSIFLTMVSSGSNASSTWSFVSRGILDAGTLNGTLDTMGVGHDKTNPDPENSYTDYDGPFTLTFISCP
jgi:hypothetical protein